MMVVHTHIHFCLQQQKLHDLTHPKGPPRKLNITPGEFKLKKRPVTAAQHASSQQQQQHQLYSDFQDRTQADAAAHAQRHTAGMYSQYQQYQHHQQQQQQQLLHGDRRDSGSSSAAAAEAAAAERLRKKKKRDRERDRSGGANERRERYICCTYTVLY
jgi:hypothetical protein